MRYLTLCLSFIILAACTKVPAATASNNPIMKTGEISLIANNKALSGILDTPLSGEADALIIIVHGYGPTDVVSQNWYYDLRSLFATKGISTFVWDKPGRGKSEGVFDANQPVESSAEEVMAAAKFLRDNNISGAQNIGLWGLAAPGGLPP